MEKSGFDLGGAGEGEGSKNGNPDRVSAIQRCIEVNNKFMCSPHIIRFTHDLSYFFHEKSILKNNHFCVLSLF